MRADAQHGRSGATGTPQNYGEMGVGSGSAYALSYSAVKLFSKNSNLCDHDT